MNEPNGVRELQNKSERQHENNRMIAERGAQCSVLEKMVENKDGDDERGNQWNNMKP